MQVLARYLGERFSTWQHPDDVLPFRLYQGEKELCASELEHGHKPIRLQQFKKAVKVKC